MRLWLRAMQLLASSEAFGKHFYRTRSRDLATTEIFWRVTSGGETLHFERFVRCVLDHSPTTLCNHACECSLGLV
jgi:hypothetical protein